MVFKFSVQLQQSKLSTGKQGRRSCDLNSGAETAQCCLPGRLKNNFPSKFYLLQCEQHSNFDLETSVVHNLSWFTWPDLFWEKCDVLSHKFSKLCTKKMSGRSFWPYKKHSWQAFWCPTRMAKVPKFAQGPWLMHVKKLWKSISPILRKRSICEGSYFGQFFVWKKVATCDFEKGCKLYTNVLLVFQF